MITLAREAQWLFHLATITRQAGVSYDVRGPAWTEQQVDDWFSIHAGQWCVVLSAAGIFPPDVPAPDAEPEAFLVLAGESRLAAQWAEFQLARGLWRQTPSGPERAGAFRERVMDRRIVFLQRRNPFQKGDLVRAFMAAWCGFETGWQVRTDTLYMSDTPP